MAGFGKLIFCNTIGCMFLRITFSSHFYPFYLESDERWKNSIRHNLSLYPEFVKGAKTQQCTGHLWSLEEEFRKRLELEKSNKNNKELRLGQSDKINFQINNENEAMDVNLVNMPSFFEDNSRLIGSSNELQKSAAEILAGVKRPTTVEGIHCTSSSILSSTNGFKLPFEEERDNL